MTRAHQAYQDSLAFRLVWPV
jgi:hypothetical protein